MKLINIATVSQASDDGKNFFCHVVKDKKIEKPFTFYFAAMSCLYLYNIFEMLLPADEREDFSDNFLPLFLNLFEGRLKTNKIFESSGVDEKDE